MNFLPQVMMLGLRASGLALARWCARCGARVTVADLRIPQLAALQIQVGAAFVCSGMGPALLEGTVLTWSKARDYRLRRYLVWSALPMRRGRVRQ
jgi:hypothetical protein